MEFLEDKDKLDFSRVVEKILENYLVIILNL